MNSIAINVKTDDGSIIGTLDVFETEMNIVYQMIDIKDPEKRKANYVREFELPGTKNNNMIFNGISENGYSVHNYNANKRLIAQVILNDNIFFEGNLQLNEITKLDNNKIGYRITIYGALSDFFNDIGSYPMSILDISEYNHKLTMPNIYSSWAEKVTWRRIASNGNLTTQSGNGYIWKFGVKTPFRLGEGYVYPLQWMGQDTEMEIDLNNWQPAIYAKTLFDKIFSKYGYKYKSNFIESEAFRKLILPYSRDTVSVSDKIVQQNEFLANMRNTKTILKTAWSTVSQTYPGYKVMFTNDTVAPAVDTGDVFNVPGSTYTVGKNGYYKLNANIKVGVTITGKQPGGGILNPVMISGPNFTGKIYIKDETGAILKQSDFVLTIVPAFSVNGGAGVYAGTSIVTTKDLEYIGYLAAGKRYRVEVDFTSTNPSGVGSRTFNQGTGGEVSTSFEFYVFGVSDSDSSFMAATIVDKTVAEDDLLDMNLCLPDMTMTDFITSINKMFNLYWQPTGEEKEFIIEPRDVIYQSTLAKDWTDKVNNGKVVSIKPLYDLTGNKYKFSYSQDNDYYNFEYNKAFGETYGTKIVTVENDFVTESVDITTKFCATPTVNFLGLGMYTPAFVSESGATWKRAVVKQRILQYGGLLAIPGSTNIKLRDDFNKYNGSTLWRVYPYAGHFDNPTNPTTDINYGVSKKYYYDWAKITDANLFNKYWACQILESTDATSHLLTVEVLLSDLDMTNFDLTWIIQVDNVHYRINKVTYNPLTGLAEAELFKAKDIIVPTAKTLDSSPGLKPIDSVPSPWLGGAKFRTFGTGETPYDTTNYGQGIFSPLSPSGVQGLPTLLPTFTYTPVPQENYGIDYPNEGKSLWNNWSDVVPLQGNTTGVTDTNSYNIMTKQEVVGKRNNIDKMARNIKVVGDDNSVMEDAKNVSIQGNNNRVLAGVENVQIVGDNQIVTESNISLIQGMKIKSGGVIKSTRMITSNVISKGIIGGGFNSTSSINKEGYRGVISGGIDSAL